jgi:hypothetical protein
MRLFGAHTNFAAMADVRVTDVAGKEWMRLPMEMKARGQSVRMDINMEQLVSAQVPAATLATLKQAGMHRLVSLMRVDQGANYVIYPERKGYLKIPLGAEASRGKDGNVQVRREPQGKENIDGQPCAKVLVTIGDAKGPLFQATVWEDPTRQNFPAQIKTMDRDNFMVMKFKDVKLAAGEAALFELPKGLTEYQDPEALMRGESLKKAAPGATNRPASGPAVGKKEPAKAGTPNPAVGGKAQPPKK